MQIQSREDADRALMRLGEISRARATAKARCEEAIKKARERFKATEDPLQEEARALERALQDWAMRDRTTWAGRSIRLRHGRLGFRRTTSLRLMKKAQTVINLLKARGLKECILVKENVNRELLRQLDDEVIRAVGARKITRDVFFAEPAEEPKLA